MDKNKKRLTNWNIILLAGNIASKLELPCWKCKSTSIVRVKHRLLFYKFILSISQKNI